MRFLVVGASGFVGSHAFAHSKSLGFQTIGTQSKPRHQGLIEFDLVRHRFINLKESSLFKVGNHTFGIICAAISQIDQCRTMKETSYLANVQNTIQLIKDFCDLKIKPVFVSTSFVFDGSYGYYTEEATRNPICEYGRQKALVEQFIEEEVPGALILRLDKVIGNNPSEEHLFSHWSSLAGRREPIICIKGQLFSPTLVDDIAKAIVVSCQMNLSGIYHVANSEFFTRAELARQFIRATKNDTEIIIRNQEELDFSDLRPLKSYLNTTKFIKTTKIHFTSVREALDVFIGKQ